VLEELEGVFSNMDIVINIKEEEYKEKIPNLTTENLEQIQKEMGHGQDNPEDLSS